MTPSLIGKKCLREQLVSSRQSMKGRAATRSTRQVMSPRRAILGCQRERDVSPFS